MKSHERYRWAAGVLDVKSDDHILEVGCGVGFAVEEILPRVAKGKITAIDRSPIAIAKAVHRNAGAVKSGKVKFFKTDLLGFSKEATRYNKIFFFNINFFWTNKSIAKECIHLRSLLMTKGLLYIFYGPMIGKGFEKTAQLVRQNLEKENIRVLQSFYEDKLTCCCIVAAP